MIAHVEALTTFTYREKHAQKSLDSGRAVLMTPHSAVIVKVGITAKLSGGLHAHCYRQSFRGSCAEITPLVAVILTLRKILIIIIVMVAPPVIVKHLAIGYLALYLHPSVGKGDVLKIDKSCPDLGYRTGIAALHKVTARKPLIEKSRTMLAHTGREKH